MPSRHSILYAELRHIFKNKLTRLAILITLCLTTVYVLHPAISYADTYQGRLSSQPGFNELGVTRQELSSEIRQGSLRKATKYSSVGKVHAVFGEPNSVYERALKLHKQHSDAHGHPMFVLRERLLSGLWSKPAYILSVMMHELEKPEEERLEWLLYAKFLFIPCSNGTDTELTLSSWIDADIVVMNPEIPLDIFIPPTPEFDYVNVLATNDQHGLNNGCFLIRVSAWSVKLLSATIAFHIFRPEVELKYSEQSALEQMINEKYWRNFVVLVPQFWFNAYSSNRTSTAARPQDFRPGALQIHFAGNRDGKRPERMETWMDIAEQAVSPYTCPLEQSGLLQDVHDFWHSLSEERAQKKNQT
ncbi:galactosyl transferase gma12 mnn10 family protein [Phlyctema vagabunda]|uniref:Galactosyl transferase gma12 mnn10 family protein n=1 Tax=Phlyctema vagabunda TaxID=108571 RepID=A0ABR4PJK2_9HELO